MDEYVEPREIKPARIITGFGPSRLSRRDARRQESIKTSLPCAVAQGATRRRPRPWRMLRRTAKRIARADCVFRCASLTSLDRPHEYSILFAHVLSKTRYDSR